MGDRDGATSDLPPLDLLEPLIGPFGDMAFAHPTEVEYGASHVLGAVGLGAPPEPLGPEPDHEPMELLATIVDALLAHAGRRPRRMVVDALRALAPLVPPELAEPIADGLAALGPRAPAPPRWIGAVGNATVEAAWLVRHETGDGDNVALVARYPEAATAHVVGVYVDHNMGGLAKDALIFPDADEYRGTFEHQTGMEVREIPLAEAAARLGQALELTDRTMGSPATDELRSLRRLVDHYRAKLPEPAGPVEPDPAPRADGDAVLEAFLASPEGRLAAEVLGDDARTLAELAVEFAGGWLGGDPRRWTPPVTELFLLDWVPRKVASDEGLGALPTVLRFWLPFAHREIGWGDRYLEEAMSTVDELEGEYRTLIADDDRFSPATALVRRAMDEGVDLDDEAQLGAFVERVNAESAAEHAGATLDDVPPGLRDRVGEVLGRVYAVCDELLDAEYAVLAERVVADLAVRSDAPLHRGRADIWAGGVLYALGQVNGLFEPWDLPHCQARELAGVFDASAGAVLNRARAVRELLDLDAPRLRYVRSGRTRVR